MGTRMGRWATAGLGLALTLGAAAGCSPGTVAYFFLPENTIDPAMKRLASDDSKKEVRVAILSYSGPDARLGVPQSEQMLSSALGRALRDGCEANRERLTVINPRKVEEFKSSHPAWHQSDLHEIGRHLKVDYVIYLEIGQLTIQDDRSPGNLLYNGHAHIQVRLVDVNNPDEATMHEEYVTNYPSEAHAITVDPDTPPSKFTQMFLGYVAKRMSWYFTAHLPREGYSTE